MDHKERLECCLPQCIEDWGWEYHHIGIPTKDIKQDEKYIAFAKVYVSGFCKSPFGIEWMRWEEDSNYNPLVKSVPHLAFVVNNLDLEIEKRHLNVIVPSNIPSGGFRVVMIEHNGAPIELMEFEKI